MASIPAGLFPPDAVWPSQMWLPLSHVPHLRSMFELVVLRCITSSQYSMLQPQVVVHKAASAIEVCLCAALTGSGSVLTPILCDTCNNGVDDDTMSTFPRRDWHSSN
jgi:hypothetical protein